MDRMTDEHAAGLIDQMEALTDQLEAANRSQRRLKIITAAVVAIVGAVIFMVAEQRSDGKDLAEQADRVDRAVAEIQSSRIQQCVNGNQTRLGQRKAWTELLTVSDASAAAQGIARDNPIRVYYRDYIDWIETDVFPDRDCTDLDKEYSEPLPAPSFEKALAESLAQQDD